MHEIIINCKIKYLKWVIILGMDMDMCDVMGRAVFVIVFVGKIIDMVTIMKYMIMRCACMYYLL